MPIIPINTQTIDFMSTVTNSIQALVTSGSPVFLSAGSQLLTAIAIIRLVIYGLKWAATNASNHQHAHFDLPGAIHFFALFLIAESFLRYYNVPLPWTSSSISSILPDTGRQLSAAIDISSLNAFNDRINAAVAGMEMPGFNFLMILVYYAALGFMTLVQAVLFAVTVVGFVAIGIGVLMGPLFIPWLIVPRLAWLFWNWISFMLEYSFYPVIASALTYIWSNVILTFMNNTVQGDYSLGHFLVLLAPLAMLALAMVYSVLRVTSYVHDLFKGGSSTGAGYGATMGVAIGGAFQ